MQVRNSQETRYYVIIKGSLYQEDITIINIYAPNVRAPKYIKQILTELKWETKSNAIIVKNFNIVSRVLLTIMDVGISPPLFLILFESFLFFISLSKGLLIFFIFSKIYFRFVDI